MDSFPLRVVGWAKEGGIIPTATDAAALEMLTVFVLPFRTWLLPIAADVPPSIDCATLPSNEAGTRTEELKSEDVEC